MRVAVIGGGINGAGIAWELARKDYQVTLFDKGRCGAQTSSKTTKMIHGGIRYLENMHFRLVRESLRDRAWLIEHLSQLVQPIEIVIPVYADSPRSRFTIRTGLILYDRLAGRVEGHALGLEGGRSEATASAAASASGTGRSTTSRSCAPSSPPPPAKGRPFARRRRCSACNTARTAGWCGRRVTSRRTTSSSTPPGRG